MSEPLHSVNSGRIWQKLCHIEALLLTIQHDCESRRSTSNFAVPYAHKDVNIDDVITKDKDRDRIEKQLQNLNK